MSCPILPTLPADLTNRFGQAKGWNSRVSAFNTGLCDTLESLEQALAALPVQVDLADIEARIAALEARLDAVTENAEAGWVTVNTTPYNVSGIVGGLLVNTLSGAKTINLPSANGYLNRVLVIKDDSGLATTNHITVIPAGTDTIDDEPVMVIDSNYAGFQLKATSSGWEIV